jgi:iron(III) transport system permease protein
MKLFRPKNLEFYRSRYSVLEMFRTLYQKIGSFWCKRWKGHAPSILLFLLSFTTSILMAIPVLYVIWRSIFAGKERWIRLLDTRIPGLLWNTLSLATTVTLFSIGIGVLLAYLVQRCEIPGRKLFQWLLALPLLIPPYVGAVTYIIIFGPRGWAQNHLGYSLIRIYSFWGVVFVLTMFCYPYVFLIVGSSLKKMNRNFEEVARTQGLNPSQVFWKVTFPLLRPAMGAGGILVFLYVLSDFGAISMLRYNTFTSAIYYQMGSYDNLSATILSMVLILITVFVIWIEAHTRKKQKFYQSSRSAPYQEMIPLGKWKGPALFAINIMFGISVLLPLSVLLYWAYYAILSGSFDLRFWGYLWNSIKVSSLAAIFCMVLSLPLVYIKSRYPSAITTFMDKCSYSGYSLPGVIVALGIIFVFNRYIPLLYNTFFLLSIAYIIRFLPQSMQSGESSLSLISPSIDEASRNLGYGPSKTLFKVILPLMAPGILSGGAMVFVSSMKELTATLLLRPPGFDTLAVRIWVETSESMYHLAAPSALFIILLAIIPLKWMLNKY